MDNKVDQSPPFMKFPISWPQWMLDEIEKFKTAPNLLYLLTHWFTVGWRHVDLQTIKTLSVVCKSMFTIVFNVQKKRCVFHIQGTLPPHLEVENVKVIHPSAIPPSAVEVTITSRYDMEEEELLLPPSVTFLNIGPSNPLLNYLPPNLTHLVLGIHFNKPIVSLPPSLTHLTLQSNFSLQPLEVVPPTLTALHLACNFEAPYNLTKTKISPISLPANYKTPGYLHDYGAGTFNHFLPNLTQLYFSEYFDSPVDNLPPSLTKLTFGYKFNHKVDSLPPSLTFLQLPGQFAQTVDNLPPSLNTLIVGVAFNSSVDSLPPSLTRLQMPPKGQFNQSVDSLPPSLTFLQVGERFNKPVNFLPQSLKILKLGRDFNQPVHSLPSSLKKLSFGSPGFKTFYDNDYYVQFDQNVYSLPPSLTCLKFGNRFNQPVDNLPPSLTTLKFGNDFKHPVDSLPHHLKYLTFAQDYLLKISKLPPSLREITLSSSYPHPLPLPLPIHLKIIYASYRLPPHSVSSSAKITFSPFISIPHPPPHPSVFEDIMATLRFNK